MNLKRVFKSKLFGSTIIYSITNAIYSGLPLLLLPFLVRHLSPEDYGVVEMFRSFTLVTIPILGLSVVQSIGRFYFDLSIKEFKELISSIQIFQFLTSLGALLIIWISSSFLNAQDVILLYLSIVYFYFNQVTESLLIFYRVEEKPKKFLKIRILNIILELGIMVILYLLFNKFNWFFRVFPIVMASVITGCISFVIFRKDGFKLKFSKPLLKQSLSYSTPLILHMLSGYILNIGDRFFIKAYLSPNDLGYYSVAYQAGMAINFFYTSFNLAWTPTFFKLMKEGNFIFIAKMRKLVYIGILALALLIGSLWYFLFPFIDNSGRYNISFEIVGLILVSYTILSFYKFETNYYLYNKSTKKLSLYTMVSALVSIIINVLLIPKIGILGAAISTLISFLCVYFLVMLNKNNVEES